MNWQEQVVLVTGGTGSFGKKFVEVMLRDYHPQKLIIFSRDELKQHDMRTAGFDHPSLRYFHWGRARPATPAARPFRSDGGGARGRAETGAGVRIQPV